MCYCCGCLAGWVFFYRTCTFFAPSRRNWIRVFCGKHFDSSNTCDLNRSVWKQKQKPPSSQKCEEWAARGADTADSIFRTINKTLWGFSLDTSDNFKPSDSVSLRWPLLAQRIYPFQRGIYQQTIRQIVNTQNFYLTHSSQLHCIWFISYNNTWNAFNTHNGKLSF